MPGKILVLRGGAIGDFILTLPVLAALREHFPETHLEVLGYPHIAELALAGGLVDRLQSIDARPLAGFFARNGILGERLSDYFASFAVIISYLYDPDRIFQANVARCSKAQFIAGPYRPNEIENVHATEVFLKPIERLAIFAPDSVPRLQIQPAASPSPHGNITPAGMTTIAVHPGSGSERKNWPEENWAALLRRLADTADANVLLVGGEAEGERLGRLAATLPANRIRLAQSLPLVELAACLAECRLFLGHDSGITHLAAAVGLRGLVLWGETNERVWRPRSERMTLLRGPGELSRLPVEKVAQHVHSALLEA
jgi:heptosyltransferase-3